MVEVAAEVEIDQDLGGHRILAEVDHKDILVLDQNYQVVDHILFQIDLAEAEDSSRHNLEVGSSGSGMATRRDGREGLVEVLELRTLAVLVSRNSKPN